jgi:hypothetical protein
MKIWGEKGLSRASPILNKNSPISSPSAPQLATARWGFVYN